jgi:Zn-dependent protease
VLNLIPVIPLDGGRMMASILGPSRIETTLKISMVVAIVGGIGLYALTKFPLFSIFLGLMAFQNWQELKHRRGP